MMIDNKQIEIARKHFEQASKEFGFTLISPYCVDENSGLTAFGYIPEYGSKNGVVFSLISPPALNEDIELCLWCKRNDRFYSSLNIEPLIGEYNSSYFQELLEDWKIY